MNPEPLKNKGLVIGYSIFDIKSAIDWLEERQVEEWIKFENGDISINTVKYNLRTHQLNAFADIISNKL